MPSNSNSYSGADDTTSPPQLNLFPLRPSSVVADDDNVEYLFNSAADGSATTLTSIFGAVSTSSTSSSSMTSEDNNNNNHDDLLLARTALRKKERDRSREERWVCYSEVMSGGGGGSTWPPASEGGGGGGGDEMMMKKRRRRRLELKLDYQEIMNSWGRPLIHIQMESPATVPELMINLDHHQQQSTIMISPDHTGGWDQFSNDGGLWRVPETEKKWNNNNNNKNKIGENMKIKEEGIEGGSQHLREASMLRYKEKRQSRLFSKRIRYQVRKINAEKRPRLKGRFVKKS